MADKIRLLSDTGLGLSIGSSSEKTGSREPSLLYAREEGSSTTERTTQAASMAFEGSGSADDIATEEDVGVRCCEHPNVGTPGDDDEESPHATSVGMREGRESRSDSSPRSAAPIPTTVGSACGDSRLRTTERSPSPVPMQPFSTGASHSYEGAPWGSSSSSSSSSSNFSVSSPPLGHRDLDSGDGKAEYVSRSASASYSSDQQRSRSSVRAAKPVFLATANDSKWLVAAAVLALITSYPLIFKPAYQASTAILKRLWGNPNPSLRV